VKKVILFLVYFAPWFSAVTAQNIYVSEDNNIWRLNPEDCNYSFVIHINDYGFYDIAFDTSGNLYGISGFKLLKINTINGDIALITIFPDSSDLDAMTISAKNIVYVSGSGGELFSYDLKTGMQTYLGNIGYAAAVILPFTTVRCIWQPR
jgi:hypothetical protein